MTPGVSAGSNHVGASETVAAKVTCPSAASAGDARARERTRATADASVEWRAMETSPSGGGSILLRVLDRPPHALRRGRHVEARHAQRRQRVQDGVDDGARRADGPALAGAL